MAAYELNIDRILQTNFGNLDDFIRQEVSANPNGAIKKYIVDQCVNKLQNSFDNQRSVLRESVTINYVLDSKAQNILSFSFSNFNILFTTSINVSYAYLKSIKLLLLKNFVIDYRKPNNSTLVVLGGNIADNILYFGNDVHTCHVNNNYNDSVYTTYCRLSNMLDNKTITASVVSFSDILNHDFSASNFCKPLFCSYINNFDCTLRSNSVLSVLDFLSFDMFELINSLYARKTKNFRFYMPFIEDILFKESGIVNDVIKYRIKNDKIKFYFSDEALVVEFDLVNYMRWIALPVVKTKEYVLKIVPGRNFGGFLELNAEYYNTNIDIQVDLTFWNHCFDKKYIVQYRSYDNYKRISFLDVINPFYKYGEAYTLKKIVIDGDLVEKGKEYAYRVSAEKFKPAELFSYLQSHNRRWFIGGKDVLTKTCVTKADELYVVAHAIYLDVYSKKYTMSKSLQLNVDTINLSRNLAKCGLLRKILTLPWLIISHTNYCSYKLPFVDTLNKLHSYLYFYKIGHEITDELIVSDVEMCEFSRTESFANNLRATYDSGYVLQDDYEDLTLDVSKIYKFGYKHKDNKCRATGNTHILEKMKLMAQERVKAGGLNVTTMFFVDAKLIHVVPENLYFARNSDVVVYYSKGKEIFCYESIKHKDEIVDMSEDDINNFHKMHPVEPNRVYGHCVYETAEYFGFKVDHKDVKATPRIDIYRAFSDIFGVTFIVYNINDKKKLVYGSTGDTYYIQLLPGHVRPLIYPTDDFSHQFSKIHDMIIKDIPPVNVPFGNVETINELSAMADILLSELYSDDLPLLDAENNQNLNDLSTDFIDVSNYQNINDANVLTELCENPVSNAETTANDTTDRVEEDAIEIASDDSLLQIRTYFDIPTPSYDDICNAFLEGKEGIIYSDCIVLVEPLMNVNYIKYNSDCYSEYSVFEMIDVYTFKLSRTVSTDFIVIFDDNLIVSYDSSVLIQNIERIYRNSQLVLFSNIIDVVGLLQENEFCFYDYENNKDNVHYINIISSGARYCSKSLKVFTADTINYDYEMLRNYCNENIVLILPTFEYLIKYKYLTTFNYKKLCVYYLYDNCETVLVRMLNANSKLYIYDVFLNSNEEISTTPSDDSYVSVASDITNSEFYLSFTSLFSELQGIQIECQDHIISSSVSYPVTLCNNNAVFEMLCLHRQYVWVLYFKNNICYIGVDSSKSRKIKLSDDDIIIKLNVLISSFRNLHSVSPEILKNPYYSVEIGMLTRFSPEALKHGLVIKTHDDIINTYEIVIKSTDVYNITMNKQEMKLNVDVPRAYFNVDTVNRLNSFKNEIDNYTRGIDVVLVQADIEYINIVKIFSDKRKIYIFDEFVRKYSLLTQYRPSFVEGSAISVGSYMNNCINEIRETWFWTIRTITENLTDVFLKTVSFYENNQEFVCTMPTFGLIDVKRNKWVVKPQKQLCESYTHAFNGENLIELEECVRFTSDGLLNYRGKEKYLAVSCDTVVVNSQFLYQNTYDYDILKFNTIINLLSGAPGSGKSTYILDNVRDGDLVLTTTKAGCTDLKTRFDEKKIPYCVEFKTGDSYLMHSRKKYTRLFIDEGFMKHPGELLLYILFSGSKETYILGDCAQIPYINRFRQVTHCCDIKYINLNEEYRCTTYRCPLDVTTTINKMAMYPFVVTTNNSRNSTMFLSKVISLNLVPKDFDIYLTYLQAEKNELKSKGYNCYTVHEYQGQQAEKVALVRLTPKNHEIFKSLNHILVSLTRHTHELTYYTVDDKDLTSKLIKESTFDNKYLIVTAAGCNVSYDTDYIMYPQKYEIVTPHKISKKIIDSYFLYDTVNLKPVKTNTIYERIDSINEFNTVSLSVEYLQDVIDIIYPGRSAFFHNYDSYIYDTCDVIVNVDNVTVNAAYHHVNYKDYAIPLLRTGIQPPIEMTVSSLMYSYGDRNGCVPNYMGLNNFENIKLKGLENFIFSYIDDTTTFNKFREEPVVYDSNSIDNWLSTKNKSVLMSLCSEKDFCDARLNVYEYLLKRNAKPKLDENGTHGFISPQTISAHQKMINAVFCPIIKLLKDRLVSVLRKDVLINNDMSIEEFEEKVSLFCPPDSLQEYKYMTEVDFSKYDKSQDYTCYILEEEILIALGFPLELLGLWRFSTFMSKLMNIKNKFVGRVVYQRKSGTAMTYFGNTILNMAVLSFFNKNNKNKYLFSGDDSLIFSSENIKLDTLTYDLANVFNLDSKLLKYKCLYFCSKFLIPISSNRWIILPDPVKLLIKLGRTDLVDEEHIEMYRISLIDNVKNFRSLEMLPLLEDSLYDRYKFTLSAEMLVSTIYDIVNNEEAFHSLYDTTLCINHSSKPNLEI